MMLPRVSLEFFPPKTLNASFHLWETVNALAPYGPDFVSVTYGAGGSTRKLTHEAVKALHSRFGLNVSAHLTCVDATREETLAIAKGYADAGVTDIVALRGDPAEGTGPFRPAPGGFSNSVELISALSELGKFHIRVGAYPDRHPEAASDSADIDWLKRKVDAGAKSAITQFFFEADTFFRFRDRASAAGIDIPLIPGILPIENWASARTFAKRCGAHVPDWLPEMFDTAIRDDRADLLAIAIASELCSDLLEGGVEDLHFYTLNRPTLTANVLKALGFTPKADLAKVA